MENTSQGEPAPGPNKKADKKGYNKAKIWCSVVAVVLVVALATVGWLYYDANQKITEQKNVISTLEAQIRELEGLPAGGEAGGVAASCAGGSIYAADIGNFEVTVSSPNIIIRDLDANFEGGPITDLAIGRCVTGETNVVDDYLLDQVNILAHPAATAAELRANFEAEWGSPLTAGVPVTIDGVAAQTYTGAGLFDTKLVYFDHNGIGYQIELPGTSTTAEATLTDVIADWSFTP